MAALAATTIAGLAVAWGVAPAASAKNTSAYTKLDLEKGCRWQDAEGNSIDPEEIADGACSTCPGLGENVIRICEGDLRQAAWYGIESLMGEEWSSFGQFNSIGGTVEWVISGNQPIAAIHRQFIDNANENGVPDDARRGQVLVISTVARAGHPGSCVVGYVDARANPTANLMAREVADSQAADFRCGVDRPRFHGKRGPFSGNPTALDE